MEKRHNITDITEYRIKRRRAGSARWILIFVFLIACLFAGYFFSRSDFFAIDRFIVNGNSTVSDERIIELSGFSLGMNLFSMTTKDSELWLTIEPRIKSAEVRRRFPRTVEISVVERQPVALMNTGRAIIELDITGRVLSRYQVINQTDLILISGVIPENGTVPGCTIAGKGIDEALAVITALTDDVGYIGEINVADIQNIRLYTTDGVEIRLGDASDFATKFIWFKNILSSHNAEDWRNIQYIDVSIPTDSTIKYH